jgi:DNA-binding MarR family transcriptional regulator
MYSADMDDYRTMHVGRLLLELSHDFVAEANERIQKKGYDFVRAAHIAVIAQIEEEGTELSTVIRRVGTTKQAVNKIIRQLESLGVIETGVCDRDNRARICRFTPYGRKFMKVALDAVRSVEEEYEADLGATGFASLKKNLLKLAEKRQVFSREYGEEE